MVRLLTALILSLVTYCLSGQYGSPLRFTENKGQWPSPVQFRTQLGASTVWITGNELIIDLMDAAQIEAFHETEESAGHGLPSPLNRHAMKLRFIGANTKVNGTGNFALPGISNYFLGNDRSRWASNNRSFGEVHASTLYEGIDLLIEGHNGYLKYDLIVGPNVDPALIGFTYDGADDMQIVKNELLVMHSFGVLKETVPVAYQIINGIRQVVDCRFKIKNDIVSFVLGAYDKSKELIIDPTLVFSTFSGSTSDNFGYTASFDSDGFLYSGSTAFGQGYPTTLGAYQTTHAGGDGLGDGTDIAITKYDTTGTQLIWSTFLGGSADDIPHSLIVNSQDECFVFGTTSSADYPTTVSAFDVSYNGGPALSLAGLGVNYVNGSDMIITRLSADGSALVGSTYLGGADNDGINIDLRFNYADEVRGEVLLDANEDVLIVSCTYSTDLPVTTGTIQTTNAGGQEGCAFKLTAGLDAVIWGTYLGGTNDDALYSVDINPVGELFVAGGTSSANLPVSTGAVMGNFQGGLADAYMAKITPDGTTILAGTYYGTVNYDQAYFIESDMSGIPHIFGQTEAPNPTDLIQNAIFNNPNSGQLITKFNSDFTGIVWSTRLGDGNGTPDISPTAFLVDRCNKIYIAGWGSPIQGGQLSTTGLLSTPNAFQTTTTGADFFLAVYEDDMSAVTYATFYGGPTSAEHVDGGTSRFDRRGRCFQSVCAGCGGNSDFPIKPDPGAWSATNNSPNCNNGVFLFDFDAPLVTASFIAPDTICVSAAISFDNTSSGALNYQWDFGDQNNSTLAEPSHAYAVPGSYTVTLIATDPNSCNFADTATAVVTVAGVTPTLLINNDTTLCGPVGAYTLVANTNGTASNFIWSTDPDFSTMLNSSVTDSVVGTQTVSTTTFYAMAYTNSMACAAVDSVVVTVSLRGVGITGNALVCADETIPLTVTGADNGSSYTWSPTTGILSGQGTATVMVNAQATTNYDVVVASPSGCSSTLSTIVTVSALNGSSVTATGSPTVIQDGGTAQLNATPTSGVSYTWSPASTLNNPNIANPIASPSVSTWYTVLVTDGVCSASDSLRVVVRELNCAEPDIFVPNAFSPNGDGSNDLLFVRSGFITDLDFRIFDRWGEKVFQTDDQSLPWDGTYKGKLVDPAVFVYYLDAVCADGQTFFKKGNITVVE